MLDVEVFGAESIRDAPPFDEMKRLCVAAAASAGVTHGHVAVEFVDSERIAQLNGEHRGKPAVTDVLSFPIDGAGTPGGGDSAAAPLELGDVVICPAHTADIREAIVHGVLHLVGMDHEIDEGEMLAMQHQLLEQAAR
jgi:probable rRNA maturation factor